MVRYCRVVAANPEDYFAGQGFALTFRSLVEDELEALYLANGFLSRTKYRRLRASGVVGPGLADLRSIKNPTFGVEAYGTGASEADAALRAMNRWRTEQGD